MNERPRAAHFLLELLIAIAVFAVCASVCIWIFFEAFNTAADARDLNYALIAARNAAEESKAYGSPQAKEIFYDSDWQLCAEPAAAFILSFTESPNSPPWRGAAQRRGGQIYELKVSKINGEEIISFSISTRGNPYE